MRSMVVCRTARRSDASRSGLPLPQPGIVCGAVREDVRPGRQGQPRSSKLDRHEVFILGLIEEARNIALAEIGERLAEEHGVSACPATVWDFLDERGMTFNIRQRTRASSNARI